MSALDEPDLVCSLGKNSIYVIVIFFFHNADGMNQGIEIKWHW